MSAMTVSSIVTRVQRQFGDESGVQVTEADIIRWINDAQREAVMQHENLLQKTSFLDSVADQIDYTLPTDLLTIQTVAYKDNDDADGSYYELRFIPPKGLAEYVSSWSGDEFASDIPRYYARGEDAGELILFPRPDTSRTDSIKITYSRYSTDIVTTADAIDLPEYYHPYVLNFCLMQAYEMDEDWEAADKKASYVQSTLDFNNNRESWFGRQVYPSIVPTIEDYE